MMIMITKYRASIGFSRSSMNTEGMAPMNLEDYECKYTDNERIYDPANDEPNECFIDNTCKLIEACLSLLTACSIYYLACDREEPFLVVEQVHHYQESDKGICHILDCQYNSAGYHGCDACRIAAQDMLLYPLHDFTVLSICKVVDPYCDEREMTQMDVAPV